MIAKGIETGDMELVKAGHALLQKTTTKTVTAKKKRAAPKKRLTKPKPEPILTERDEFDKFNIQIRSDEAKRARPDGKKVARKEQVDLSRIGKSNSFSDDMSLVPVTTSDKKLYETVRPVPRREVAELVEIKCSECKDTKLVSKKLSGSRVYTCDECIKNKGRYKP